MTPPATAAPTGRSARTFVVPRERFSSAPPERRGLHRDDVRLLVAAPGRLEHRRFRELPELLAPGDLLVVNTSATLPAALDATRWDGSVVTVHVAGPAPDGGTVVELRTADGAGRIRDGRRGELLRLAGGEALRLRAHVDGANDRLWTAHLGWDGPIEGLLRRHGRPIAYGYLDDRYPLEDYQPAVARHPGSAEMASASRPLTERLVVDLVATGVAIAPVTLHTGVSSLEVGEVPPPERFTVPEATARLVGHVRRYGGRVIAVGTTVVRALESVASMGGTARAGSGWTDLVLGPDRPARLVDGMITGWHDADASHLALLEAVAGDELVSAAYEAALAADYRWHEFGDSCLLLPTG